MSRQTLTPADRTLGHAWMMGLQPYAMCLRGKRSGPVKTQPCGYRSMLCLETLIWSKGAKFPTWKLTQDRLRCPRCGGLSVQVSWQPGPPPAARAGQDLYQCAVAAGVG